MITTGLVVAFFVSYGCRNIPSDWSFRLPFLLQMAVRLLCLKPCRGPPGAD